MIGFEKNSGMRRTFYLLLAGMLATVSLLQGQPADEFTNEIIDRTHSYFIDRPHDNLFIHTDRSVYFPGERILFRLVVADAANLRPSERSDKTVLHLLDQQGVDVMSLTVEPQEGYAHGSILLPTRLAQGSYTLMGYLMQGDINATHKVFKKNLVITNPEEQLMMDYSFDREKYHPSDDFELTVSTYGNRSKGISGVKVDYEIKSDEGILLSGDGKTSRDGTLKIGGAVPANPEGDVIIDLRAEKRRSSQQMSIRLPVADAMERLCSGKSSRAEAGSGSGSGEGAGAGAKAGAGEEAGAKAGEGEVAGARESGSGAWSDSGHSGAWPVGLNAEISGSRLRVAAEFADAGISEDTRVIIGLFRKGLLYWSAPGMLGQTGELLIPLSRVPSGILNVVMFEVGGGVIAEEMVFFERGDAPEIEVELDRADYGRRQHIKAVVKLKGKLPKEARDAVFSVSVAPEDMLAGADWLIDDQMMIDADLKQDTREVLQGAVSGEERSEVIGRLLDCGERNGYSWADITGEGELTEEQLPTGWSSDNSYIPDGFSAERMMDFADGIIDSRQPDAAMLNYKRQLENGMSVLSVIKSIKPYTMQGNKIVFSGTTNSINFQQGALIVIDNIQAGEDASVLSTISPTDVESIYVSTNPSDIQKYTGLNVVGVIEITMKGYQGGSRLSAKDPREQMVHDHYGEYLPGYPDYAIESDAKSVRLDHRRLLFWQPDLRLNADGEAEISFYTSDMDGRYVVTVQGMAGTVPVAVQQRFTVK